MNRHLFLSLGLVVATTYAHLALGGLNQSGIGDIDRVSYSTFFSSGQLEDVPLPFDDNLHDGVAPIQIDLTEIQWTPEGMNVARVRGGLSFHMTPMSAIIQVAPGTGVAGYRHGDTVYDDLALSFREANLYIGTDGSYAATRGGHHSQLRGSVGAGARVDYYDRGQEYVSGFSHYEYEDEWTNDTPGEFSQYYDGRGPLVESPPFASGRIRLQNLVFLAAPGTDGSTTTINDTTHSKTALELPDPATAQAAMRPTLLAGPTVDFGVVRAGSYSGPREPVLSLLNMVNPETVVQAQLPIAGQWNGRSWDYSFSPDSFNWLEFGEGDVVSYGYYPMQRGEHSATVVVPDGAVQSQLLLTGTAVGPVVETGLPSRELFVEWITESYSVDAGVLDFSRLDLSSSQTLSFEITNATTDLDPVPDDNTFTALTLLDGYESAEQCIFNLARYSLEDHKASWVDFQDFPVSVEGPEPGTVLLPGESVSVDVTLGPLAEPLGSDVYLLVLQSDENSEFGVGWPGRYILLVPEPSSLILLLAAVAGFWMLKRLRASTA